MGNCSSCFGDDRRRGSYDEEDEAQRLFDDPSTLHYGGFDAHHMNGPEDPLEVQREIEALQRVVARTSDNMIDVYEIVPQMAAVQQQESPTSSYDNAYSGQVEDSGSIARYQNLLAKLSVQDDYAAAVAHVDWGSSPEDDERIEMSAAEAPVVTPVKVEVSSGGDALVGNFADAAAAMH